jgi:putative inorganic carbon (hco3(-)) transporter
MPLRSVAFLVLFIASAAGSLINPMIGVLAYVAIYHIFPETTWWGRALRPLGIRYSFIAGMCVLISAILNSNRLKFGRHFFHPVEIGVILIFLIMVFSTTFAGAWVTKTELLIDKMSKVVLFALLISHVAVTRQRLWQLTVLLVVMTLYLGHTATNAPPGAFNQNRLDGIGGPDFRESAGLAIHLFALMPFVAVVFRQKSLKLKTLAFFAGGYGVNGILLCRARSALLGGIAAGVVALWYVPRKSRGWVVCVLIMAALGGTKLSDESFWDRMATTFSTAEERDASAAGRLEIWQASWEMIKDNPLGVGMGQFHLHIGDYGGPTVHKRDAHNTYVLCAGEIGIPGLMAYLGTVLVAWMTLNKASRRIRAELADRQLLELLVFASRLSIIVYVVSGLFVSRLYTEGAWWFVLLPACITRAVENKALAQVQADTRTEELVPAELPLGLGAVPA